MVLCLSEMKSVKRVLWDILVEEIEGALTRSPR
jgi:hypothetical protein